MEYHRPQPRSRLDKPKRQALLRAYFRDYGQIFEKHPDALNRKIPKEAFSTLLDLVGGLLLRTAGEFAKQNGPVRQFLETNPVPNALQDMLPDDYRAYCLALNALKQWVSAEQAATDRYLLGGNERKECRAASTQCVVSGVDLDPTTVELHHPVRDGRPPIPISKQAHALIEGQLTKS